jgi:hypothetical protein
MCWEKVDDFIGWGYNVGYGGKHGIATQDFWTYGGWSVLDPVRSGDEVQVVWEASSGGKTQTLNRYTVQSGYQGGAPIDRTY